MRLVFVSILFVFLRRRSANQSFLFGWRSSD
jgi:hypothetical protein